MPPNKNDIEHPSLERKDLDPAAREPLTDKTGEGWGSYYPGPLETDPDESLLDKLDATANPTSDENAQPRQIDLSGPPDPWGNQPSHDFRRETVDYEEDRIRPPDEEPGSEPGRQ